MLVTPILASCTTQEEDSDPNGTKSTQETTTGPTDSEKDATIEDWLPVKSYGVAGGKRQMNFLTCDDYNRKYYFFRTEDGEGDPLAASSYKRYCKIEETYDVVLNVIEENDIFGSLTASLLGQGGEYDLVYPHPTEGILSILSSGFFENLYQFENLHLDQPWWNQSQVDAYTVDDRLYMAVSDFSLSGQGFIGLIYNRDIYEDLRINENLYRLVENGEWTVSKMRELVMKFGDDVNNDSKYDEKDTYGFIFQPQHTKNFYWSFGGRVVEKDGNGEYSLGIDKNSVSTMASALYTLAYESENKVFISEACTYGTFSTSNGWATFKGKQALFMTYDLGGLYSYLNELNFKIGYLPYPTLTEGTTDYPVVCAAGFLAIPKKAQDSEMSSVILEALSIFSYSDYRPTFFNAILLGRMSEQEEDYAMLEFMHENKVFDMGFTFTEGGAADLLHISIIDQKNPGMIASYIQGHQREMEKILDHIEDIRNGKFEG